MPRCDQTLSQGSAAAVPPGQSAQPRGTTSCRRHARQLSTWALSAFARAPCAVRAGAHARWPGSPAPAETRAGRDLAPPGGRAAATSSGTRWTPRRGARARPPPPLRRPRPRRLDVCSAWRLADLAHANQQTRPHRLQTWPRRHMAQPRGAAGDRDARGSRRTWQSWPCSASCASRRMQTSPARHRVSRT